jgi:hypothetical protein
MKDVIARLQRELPDTDRDRYDVAYERGRAQARSGLLAGGLALGSAVGAGLMWLLDPVHGAGRRAELTSRVTGLKNQVAKTAGGKAEDLQNRANGFAIERGIKQLPGPTSTTEGWDSPSDGSPAESGQGTDYGEGYREGFGQTVDDPTAPGSQVPDPIEPQEVAEYGASGPVAGAAHEERTSVVSTQTEDEEAALRR